MVAACMPGDEFDPLPVPDALPAPSSTTTSVPIDYSGVALAAVAGTTTTTEVVIGPGRLTLAGRVDGPDGPVAGATVRVERLVGDSKATVDVVTDEGGGWNLAGVLGGRYRIRGWRVPDLAGIEPQILFVPGEGTSEVVLAVERFGGTVVETAMAPTPPVVGQRTSLRVRVSQRSVDSDGVVATVPSAGSAVRLEPAGGWGVEGPSALLTDGEGTEGEGGATFTVACRTPGPQPLSVTLPDSVVALGLPDCVAPPPPQPAPPETAPPETPPPPASADPGA